MRLEEATSSGRNVSAKIIVDKQQKTGAIKRTPITARHASDLAKLTGRDAYAGLIVAEIAPSENGGGYVRFANNVEIRQGVQTGTERDALFEAQIRFTITEHFAKQARLRERGIKVLSLFFIDKVASFAADDGIVRTLFVKAFDEVKASDPAWRNVRALDVQKSYFATKTRKDGAVEALESTGRKKEDEAAFNLIMRDKERLLSFDEPTAFIFSHSALKEGWDSPNVFQVCALREANEMTRRQQVGRGVRLAVDQNGDRMRDMQVNVLTVVAGEHYERFVQGLQSEIEAEYGAEGLPPKPPEVRQRRVLKLRKAYIARPEFTELWKRISARTRYRVAIDTPALIEAVVPELDKAEVRRPRITVSKARFRLHESEDRFDYVVTSGVRTLTDLAGRYPLPNLLAVIENLMEATSPPMRMTRTTMLAILKRTANTAAMLDNPHDFAAAAVRIVKERLADQLVDGITYERDGSWYDQTLFVDTIDSYADRIVDSRNIDGVGGTHLYDGVEVDSDVERSWVHELERRDAVKLYIKLPGWFTVETPVGRYNPDWAIVLQEEVDERLFLVRESKGPSTWTSSGQANDEKLLVAQRILRKH